MHSPSEISKCKIYICIDLTELDDPGAARRRRWRHSASDGSGRESRRRHPDTFVAFRPLDPILAPKTSLPRPPADILHLRALEILQSSWGPSLRVDAGGLGSYASRRNDTSSNRDPPPGRP